MKSECLQFLIKCLKRSAQTQILRLSVPILNVTVPLILDYFD